ncbi:MAG: glycosyltransferase family 2 protein [Deltaproteobacteria bacterium]|nr:glycosyltransferase family 2 protein [Deltaproteobacteria bacterium]
MKDITVVIVNWNTRDLLRNCLNSVYETIQGINYEVIVVDNASTDGSVQMLRDEFTSVDVIENEKNRGFGAANNQAFTIMKGRYALLLNSDTVLTKHAVHELFLFMEVHPDASLACGQLLNEDGSRQNSIASFPTLLTLLANTSLLEYLFPRRFPSKRYVHKDPVEIESAIGACVLVRREAMDAVGVFDERYFFFFEETDWAYRMRLAGWKIYHVPSALIYHLQGKSVGTSISSRIEFYRSRYQFFRKYRGAVYVYTIYGVIMIRLAINCLFTLVGNVLTVFLKRDLRSRCKVYMQLIHWHFKGCPGPSR